MLLQKHGQFVTRPQVIELGESLGGEGPRGYNTTRWLFNKPEFRSERGTYDLHKILSLGGKTLEDLKQFDVEIDVSESTAETVV